MNTGYPACTSVQFQRSVLSQYSLFEYKIESVLFKSTLSQNLESQLSKRKRILGN